MSKTRGPGGNDGRGMNWIWKPRRLTIYMRDGLACLWCGMTVDDHGCTLTLDHFLARVNGGGNASNNVFTSCMTCNRERGARSAHQFAVVMAARFDGFTSQDILAEIRRQLRRPVDLQAAKAILARRRRFVDAVRHARKSVA